MYTLSRRRNKFECGVFAISVLLKERTFPFHYFKNKKGITCLSDRVQISRLHVFRTFFFLDSLLGASFNIFVVDGTKVKAEKKVIEPKI